VTVIAGKSNEDAYCLLPSVNGILAFGVYDGHGGSFGSNFCAGRLCRDIICLVDETENIFANHPNRQAWKQLGPKAFDSIMCESIRVGTEKIDKEIKHEGTSGTTSISIFAKLQENGNIKFFPANTGDSRCALLRKSGCYAFNEDHALTLQRETDRIVSREPAKWYPLPVKLELSNTNHDYFYKEKKTWLKYPVEDELELATAFIKMLKGEGDFSASIPPTKKFTAGLLIFFTGSVNLILRRPNMSGWR
jgi:serine/threonine protein phosphatase PrpC